MFTELYMRLDPDQFDEATNDIGLLAELDTSDPAERARNNHKGFLVK